MASQITGQYEAQASRESSKNLLILAASGGAAFWIIDFVISVSPIAAQYKAAFSISSLPVALAEAFVGGMIIALCVSFFLLRSFERIPGKTPISKALFLVFLSWSLSKAYQRLETRLMPPSTSCLTQE